MREIKFRAWDIENKNMVACISVGFWADVTPEYNDDEGNYNYELQSELYEDGSGKIECYLMQYTGLKDKNGKDIYEGDVVECFSAYGGIFKAEIVFQDGCFEIQEPQGKDGVFRDYLKCLTCNHAVSVVGNIYETPKLLTAASARK